MTDEKATGKSTQTTAIPQTEGKDAAPAAKPKKPNTPIVVPEPCERPDKQAFDKEVKAVEADIEKSREILDEVKKQMDILHGEFKEQGKDSDRQKLNGLREKTKVFVTERKNLFDELEKNKVKNQALRDKSDAMQKHLKDECKVREFSTAAVQKKVSELDYYLSTNPLALKEEKEVIAQIKALNASKKIIAQYDAVQAEKEAANTARKALSAKLNDNKKNFQEAKEAEDAQWAIVKKAGDKNTDKKDRRKALLEKREKAKNEMNASYQKKREMFDDHRKKEGQWRKYMDAKRALEQERYLKEQEERREERKLQKLQEEEELEDGKHATKLSTIDQLVSYLEGFTREDKAAETKVEAQVERDGMVAIGKKAVAMDVDMFGCAVVKKSGGKKGGKKGKPKKKGMQFDVKSLQEFEQLGVPAPMTIDEITASLSKLKEKRDAIIKEKEERREKREAKIAAVEADIEAKNKKKEEEKEAAKKALEEAKAKEAETADAAPAAAEVEATA